MKDEIDRIFSADDRERIRRAARDAELPTSGEIVPYVVGRADDYRGARWGAAAWGALLGALAADLAASLLPWGAVGLPFSAAVAAATGAAVGYALASTVPSVERLLVPRAVMARRAEERAAQAFLAEEVFATRDRTGILVFLALFEHRVVILADSGIHAAVPGEEWREVADQVAGEIGRGAPTTALVEAIRRCGRLLDERRVEARPDDVNELADGLRISDR